MTPGEFRLRICYAKDGRLRWLSHLEIVRALERTVRRAQLPYAVTQGFNPHMKAAFGPALPVGTAGRNEYVDVWLTRYDDAEQILRRLAASAPADLAPVSARFIGDSAPSLTAALTIAEYSIEIEGKGNAAEQVQAALADVLETGELVVEHKGKRKVFDLARSIPKEPRVNVQDGRAEIALTVRMGPQGSLRPEALVRAVLDKAGIEASALRTTRLDTLVEDDEGVWSRPV